MHLKVIKSQQCSVERSHVVLKLILNSDHGLALLKQKQILTGLLLTKNLQKSEDFFIQLLYAWLHLTNNNLDQPILFLNSHNRMNFKHPTQEYFKFIIIRDLCTFLQPGLTSSTKFHQNFSRFSYCQQCKILKLIMGSSLNWKHLELKLLKNPF